MYICFLIFFRTNEHNNVQLISEFKENISNQIKAFKNEMTEFYAKEKEFTNKFSEFTSKSFVTLLFKLVAYYKPFLILLY